MIARRILNVGGAMTNILQQIPTTDAACSLLDGDWSETVASLDDIATIKAATFEAVWSHHGLDHLDPQEFGRLLREFRRILRPNGGFALIISSDSRDALDGGRRLLAERICAAGFAQAGVVRKPHARELWGEARTRVGYPNYVSEIPDLLDVVFKP